MVSSCCAYGCTERFEKGGAVTFHSFPKEEIRRKLWVRNIRRENFIPKEGTKICSKHFTDDCFDKTKFGGAWLKRDAVPTIFNFPIHLQEKVPLKREGVSETYSPSQPEAGTSMRKRYLGDFTPEDMTSPTTAQKVLRIAKESIKEKNAVIKDLSRKNKSLEKRVASLKEILKSLKKEALITDSSSRVLKSLNKQPGTVFGSGLDLQVTSVTPTNMVVDDSSTLISPDVDPPYLLAAGPSSQDTTSSDMVEQKVHLAMTCDIYPANVNPTDSLSSETLDVKEEPKVSISDQSLFEPAVLIKEELITSEEE